MSCLRSATLGLALLVGGCAAAVPGYIPPDGFNKYRATAPRGGGIDPAGRYLLTEQEQALDCKKLTGSIAIKIVQMREAGSRSPPSATSKAIQDAVKPVAKGGTYGADIAQDQVHDRARLVALNAQLGAKKCPTYDLDAELRPGNTERPRPVKPHGGRKA